MTVTACSNQLLVEHRLTRNMDCAKDNVCPRVMWRPDPKKTRTKQDEFREKVVNGTHDLQIGRQQIAITVF